MSIHKVQSTNTAVEYTATTPEAIAAAFHTKVESIDHGDDGVRERIDFSRTAARIELARWEGGEWYLMVDSEALPGDSATYAARNARALKEAGEALLRLLAGPRPRFYTPDGSEIEADDLDLTDLVVFPGTPARRVRELDETELDTVLSMQTRYAPRAQANTEYFAGLIADMSDEDVATTMNVDPEDVPFMRRSYRWWGIEGILLLADSLGRNPAEMLAEAPTAA